MVLDILVALSGFVGGWLLVAGPVWQAAIELQEQEIDQDAVQAAKSASKSAPSFSPWWWLLPPVAYVKQYRRSHANRQAFNAALAPQAREQTLAFLNKANGWMVVAVGAYLFAIKETYELVELIHFPIWVFWVAIVILPILAVANAVVRMVMTKRFLDPDAAKPGARAAKAK